MGLEASVQFEDEALIAAEAEFGAEFVDEVEGVEAVDADEREDEFIAARREASGVQRTLDATQMYLSEIGFSPLLTAEEERYYARLALKGEVAMGTNAAPRIIQGL